MADQVAGARLETTRRRTMTTKTLRQTVVFKGASPRTVYDLIMVSTKHASLSGQKAVISQKVGGRFSAWNGHLTGFNLALRPGKKIVQAWRATGWWPDHHSIAIFEIHKVTTGTKLTFTQIGVPPHRYSGHYRGWIEAYWTPLMGPMTSRRRVLDTTSFSGSAMDASVPLRIFKTTR